MQLSVLCFYATRLDSELFIVKLYYHSIQW